jgi:hypothetical protein
MKKINDSVTNKNNVFTIVTLSGLLLFASCTPRISFLTSSVVPAAEGAVKVKNDNNNNYTVDLHVTHLAEPERLSPSKSVYVVWMETADNGIKNLGQLNTSSSMFSKTLKSSLETVTAFKPVKIFITAENDGAIQSPGFQQVLTTDKF